MGAKEQVIQAAVTLVATGKAGQAAEALSMATQLIAELERAWEAREARRSRTAARKTAAARPAAKGRTKAGARSASRAAADSGIKPLPIRALRVLERIGVARPDAAPSPRELRHKVCEAHLYSAKNCGQATVQQIATWFRDHGETLLAECATYSEDWMTSRCDEQPR